MLWFDIFLMMEVNEMNTGSGLKSLLCFSFRPQSAIIYPVSSTLSSSVYLFSSYLFLLTKLITFYFILFSLFFNIPSVLNMSHNSNFQNIKENYISESINYGFPLAKPSSARLWTKTGHFISGFWVIKMFIAKRLISIPGLGTTVGYSRSIIHF